MCARSPGAPMKPIGERRTAMLSSRRPSPRQAQAWSCLPPPATTIPAMAVRVAQMSIFPLPPHPSSAAAERENHILVMRPSGTTIQARPTEKALGAATRRFFRCHRGRPARLTAPAAWSLTLLQTPTQTPATRSFSTKSPWSSAARAPSRLSTRVCSRHSDRNSAS